MEINLFFLGFLIAAAMVSGGYFTQQGMAWYHTSLVLPSFTPPDWVFGPVWTVIYALTFVCMYRVWNYFPHDRYTTATMILFVINMVLNAAWSYLFFTRHLIGWSLLDAIALVATVIGMMVCIAQHSKVTALLLLPYAVWGAFASYLTYTIWVLNR